MTATISVGRSSAPCRRTTRGNVFRVSRADLFARRAGFATDAVAFHRRCASRAARAGSHFEHRADRARGRGLGDRMALIIGLRRGGCTAFPSASLSAPMSEFLSYAANSRDASCRAGISRINLCDLQQRKRQPITIGHGRLLDRAPAFVCPQACPWRRPGRSGPAPAQCRIPILVPHRFGGRRFSASLVERDIARHLHGLGDRDDTVIRRVVDHRRPDLEPPRRRYRYAMRPHCLGRSTARHKRLDRRARLESVDQRAVAQLLARSDGRGRSDRRLG